MLTCCGLSKVDVLGSKVDMLWWDSPQKTLPEEDRMFKALNKEQIVDMILQVPFPLSSRLPRFLFDCYLD